MEGATVTAAVQRKVADACWKALKQRGFNDLRLLNYNSKEGAGTRRRGAQMRSNFRRRPVTSTEAREKSLFRLMPR